MPVPRLLPPWTAGKTAASGVPQSHGAILRCSQREGGRFARHETLACSPLVPSPVDATMTGCSAGADYTRPGRDRGLVRTPSEGLHTLKSFQNSLPLYVAVRIASHIARLPQASRPQPVQASRIPSWPRPPSAPTPRTSVPRRIRAWSATSSRASRRPSSSSSPRLPHGAGLASRDMHHMATCSASLSSRSNLGCSVPARAVKEKLRAADPELGKLNPRWNSPAKTHCR